MPLFKTQSQTVEARQHPPIRNPETASFAVWEAGGCAVIQWVNSFGAARAAWEYDCIAVETPQGRQLAMPGDWIIREADGSFNICDPDRFALVYAPDGAAPVFPVVNATTVSPWPQP